MAVYTVGDWHVKKEHVDEFVTVWRDLIEISLSEIEPDARVVLLRDRENQRHFRSIGEFRDEEAIVRWRDGSELAERLGVLTHMLECGDTSLFEVAQTIGWSPRD